MWQFFWGKLDWFVGIYFLNACKVPLHLELIWFSFDKLWNWLAFVCSGLRPAWIRILAWRSCFDLLPQIDSCRWIRCLLIHTAQPFAIQLTRIMSSCYEKALVQTIPFSFSLFAWKCILTKHTNLWQLFFFQAEDGIRDGTSWLEFRRVLFRSNDTATTEIYTVLHTLSLHDALPI